ncbi:hypothetical protein ALC60_00351 [Trachymyrmex zeteki]|uniref:Uncharacterized protein n=1 Tax=Mycetomoellerius zeteki TaxID=64791 RepID=A0A151XJS9_9HYME|nr:hypothetical protein ALC60_00351 [Trachymyrmex zeteki]
MRRIVEEDLRYKSYTIKVRQMLSEAARTKRVERCNLLLCSLLTGNVNRHNFKYWNDENPHWMYKAHIQNQQKVNVWTGILNELTYMLTYVLSRS